VILIVIRVKFCFIYLQFQIEYCVQYFILKGLDCVVSYIRMFRFLVLFRLLLVLKIVLHLKTKAVCF
jgi:hypothetical protein